MRKYLILVALVCYIQHSTSEDVRLLDLEPTDAQDIIAKQDQSLKYAPQIDHDVPAVRYIGEEPHNVLEDIYLAKQYHGQDGLGGYLYGYETPRIAKNEEKKQSGDLKGAYNYINGAGQEIKIKYWDNGTGFHQEDNLPKILPKPVEESAAVKAAKEAFQKRWNEEAERNSHPVPYPHNNAQPQYQAAASGPQPVYAQNPDAQQDNEGAYQADNEGQWVPDEDSTGPPKGFFYAFDYPVGIITQDQGRALSVDKGKRSAKDLKNAYEENKQKFEGQLGKAGVAGSQYLIV